MAFEKNTRVRYPSEGKLGIITGNFTISSYGNEYEVDFLNHKEYVPEILLEEIPETTSVEGLLNSRVFAGIEDFRRIISHHRLEGNLTNIFYSMKNSNTEFMPHQFKPVIKFLESVSGKLLIADEVGLGKTIEAIYIMKELQTRENAKHFLIICPKTLCQKWKDDLKKKFDLESSLVTVSELANKLKEPNSKDFILICSLQAIRTKYIETETDKVKLKNAEKLNKFLLDSAEKEPKLLDMIIIDEAHYLRNSETASFKTAERFMNVSKYVLLLSATPIQTSSENLYNLLNLLAPEKFNNKKVFEEFLNNDRLRVICKANAYRKGENKEEILDIYRKQCTPFLNVLWGMRINESLCKDLEDELSGIEITPEYRIQKFMELKEESFYSQFFTRSRKNEVFIERPMRCPKTYNYSFSEQEKQIYAQITNYLKEQGKATKNATIFALINRQRQLTSCLPAALAYFNQNISTQDLIDGLYEDFEDIDLIDADDSNVCSGLQYDINADFLDQIRANDSKFNELKILLEKSFKKEPKKKIIIFSYFRGTVDYLHERFEECKFGSVKIKGGDENKEEIVNKFKDDDSINILITTEVLAEGIDLQFADTEINYDLPWNPMRLEQRIGRIDRIGQKSKKIHILNFICKDTIEDRVLERIYERMGIFRASIGELDDILGQEILNLSQEIFCSPLDKEGELEKRLMEQMETKILKQFDQQKLEEKASLTHEFSDYILDNVSEAEKNRRYILPRELINYAQDFFGRFYQGIKIESTLNPDTKKITFSNKARKDLRDYIRINNLNNSQNVALAEYAICTFGRSQIDINHALIKWMIDKNSNSREIQSKCSAIYLEKSISELTGTFVYYIDFWECKGFKNKKELRFYLCNLDGTLIKEEAESVLITALEQGKSIRNVEAKFSDENIKQFKTSLKKCIEAAKTDFAKFSDECKKENESAYKQQAKMLEATYNKKIEAARQSIETVRANDPNANVARFEGMIRTLEDKKNEDIGEMEQKSKSCILKNTESNGGICGGILKIGENA
ncbi:MAG: SNF2-related protein [Fibromonadales bacterium]|nr:SNF2-related protein [Fibromonadales bacterium]